MKPSIEFTREAFELIKEIGEAYGLVASEKAFDIFKLGQSQAIAYTRELFEEKLKS